MDCAIVIDLPKIVDQRGNLSFLEGNRHIPFMVRRSHWLYDVPGGESRGGHAFKKNKEFIVALSGSFNVVVNDGTGSKNFQLNRSYYGLYVPQRHWREIINFSTNSLALILSSEFYDESDYIWDFEALSCS